MPRLAADFFLSKTTLTGLGLAAGAAATAFSGGADWKACALTAAGAMIAVFKRDADAKGYERIAAAVCEVKGTVAQGVDADRLARKLAESLPQGLPPDASQAVIQELVRELGRSVPPELVGRVESPYNASGGYSVPVAHGVDPWLRDRAPAGLDDYEDEGEVPEGDV